MLCSTTLYLSVTHVLCITFPFTIADALDVSVCMCGCNWTPATAAVEHISAAKGFLEGFERLTGIFPLGLRVANEFPCFSIFVT